MKSIGLKGRKRQAVYTDAQRAGLVDRLFREAKDWRSSPFEGEGAMRASIRSYLCLEGHGWHRSDMEAELTLALLYRRLGARRPSWEQGQREYSIPQENCNWCAQPLPEGAKERFCSVECARVAIHWRDYETRYKESLLGSSAYRTIARSKSQARSCKHCGSTFHPLSDLDKTMFCSTRCQHENQRIVPARPCKHCGTVFQPRGTQNTSLFCSPTCYHAHGRTDRYERTCAWCFTPFVAKTARAYVCSMSCWTALDRVKKGQAKKVNVRIFDYLITHPVNRHARDLTPERFDRLVAA